jgi:thiamine-phosphate pyrophosphorylase
MKRVAATLGRGGRGKKRRSRGNGQIPRLWFLSDPIRTPDLSPILAVLPRGAAVVYRSFGAPDRQDAARRLRRLTREHGLRLLIGADWRLAARVGADGVHLPQRLMRLAPALRRRRPGWLITAAAHDAPAVVAGRRLDLDALLISPVFPSRSPSAGRALGPVRFAALATQAGVRVVALGGVNDRTARRLRSTGAAGLAGVDGFAPR